MRLRSLLLALVVLLTSCFNEDDYNIQQVTLTPTMAFPIAFGDMGLTEMISNKDTAYVRSYPDGLLYLYYSKPLPSQDIRNLFSLPDNHNTVSFNLPAGTLPASGVNTTVGTVNRQINLGLSPEMLTEVLMKSGTLDHALLLSKPTSPPNLPLQTTITFPEVVHRTTQQPLVITIGNGTTSLPLADYVFELVNNNFSVQVDLLIKPHPATFIPASTTADVHLDFNNLAFATLKGFFGDQVTPLPPQTLDISVFSSTLKDAAVSFVQPQLSLTAVNDYGVPCEVSFSYLRAKKGASTLPIQISPTSPFALNAPATLGSSATTNVTITNQQAVMNFAPERLEYAASVRINKGLSNGTNFMADTSKLRLSLNTEIPLYGRITGVVVVDTLEVDLRDINKTQVGDASLKVTAQNEMPLDANIQIYLLDESYLVKDSLFSSNQTYLVKASTVDGAGDLQHPGITDLSLSLDPERLSKLFSSRFLLVRAVLSSARDENGVFLNVKFRSTYRLKLNVGLLAQLNIEVK